MSRLVFTVIYNLDQGIQKLDNGIRPFKSRAVSSTFSGTLHICNLCSPHIGGARLIPLGESRDGF